MDLVTEILTSLRVISSIIFDAEVRGDWCVLSKMNDETRSQLLTEPGHIVAFHYIRSGSAFIHVEDREDEIAQVEQGSAILLPHNDAHLFYSRPGLPALDAYDFVQPPIGNDLAKVRINNSGALSQIYCGFVACRGAPHPLFAALPPLMVVKSDPSRNDWLGSSYQFTASTLSAAPQQVVARFAEMLVAEAVRRFISGNPGLTTQLCASFDSTVSRALSVIHERFAEDLSLEKIAREVGVSRSVLRERFVDLLGQPPMRYCSRWRMRQAEILLREGKEKSANVAYAVGFNSEAAFTRAFKREFGAPPARWRRTRLDQPVGAT